MRISSLLLGLLACQPDNTIAPPDSGNSPNVRGDILPDIWMSGQVGEITFENAAADCESWGYSYEPVIWVICIARVEEGTIRTYTQILDLDPQNVRAGDTWVYDTPGISTLVFHVEACTDPRPDAAIGDYFDDCPAFLSGRLTILGTDDESDLVVMGYEAMLTDDGRVEGVFELPMDLNDLY